MSTVFSLKENNAKSLVDAAITDVATTLTVTAGEGARFPATGNFNLAIWTRAEFADPADDTAHAEIVTCTARSTDSLTIIRAQEGTTGYAHAGGETVMLNFTKAQALEYETAINERLPQGDGSTYDTDDAKIGYSALGGLMIRLTNKTGSASVTGEVVRASTGTDDAVELCVGGSLDPTGVFLDGGIADGAEAWVVILGKADVMLENSTASVHGNWVGISATAGRADATNGSPPAAPAHFKEVGHCLESQGGGTDVLARVHLHFN